MVGLVARQEDRGATTNGGSDPLEVFVANIYAGEDTGPEWPEDEREDADDREAERNREADPRPKSEAIEQIVERTGASPGAGSVFQQLFQYCASWHRC